MLRFCRILLFITSISAHPAVCDLSNRLNTASEYVLFDDRFVTVLTMSRERERTEDSSRTSVRLLPEAAPKQDVLQLGYKRPAYSRSSKNILLLRLSTGDSRTLCHPEKWPWMTPASLDHPIYPRLLGRENLNKLAD